MAENHGDENGCDDSDGHDSPESFHPTIRGLRGRGWRGSVSQLSFAKSAAKAVRGGTVGGLRTHGEDYARHPLPRPCHAIRRYIEQRALEWLLNRRREAFVLFSLRTVCRAGIWNS